MGVAQGLVSKHAARKRVGEAWGWCRKAVWDLGLGLGLVLVWVWDLVRVRAWMCVFSSVKSV